MKWWAWTLLVLALLGITGAAYVLYVGYTIKVEKISDDLHVLYGAGGNVAVLGTDEGTVVVDTMSLELQGDRIKEVARSLTGKPVVMVINTHYHLDHTHGNPAFDAGTRVVSTDRTLEHLKQTDSEYFSGAAAALLPNETFEDSRRISLGNKHILLSRPGPGHTDGDLVVLFEEERVLHTGDLFFNRLYPNIDLEAGGSVSQWPATLDDVLVLPFDGVIPGHGPFTDRAHLNQFKAFMQQLGDLAAQAVSDGVSKGDFVENAGLTEDAGYEEIVLVVPIGLNRAFVLGRAYEEANGEVTARP